jgi:hypothetical protein
MHTKSLVEICQGIIGKHLDGKDIRMIAIAQSATGSLGFHGATVAYVLSTQLC